MLKLVNVSYIDFLVLTYQRIYNYYYHAIMKFGSKREAVSVFFKINYLLSVALRNVLLIDTLHSKVDSFLRCVQIEVNLFFCISLVF